MQYNARNIDINGNRALAAGLVGSSNTVATVRSWNTPGIYPSLVAAGKELSGAPAWFCEPVRSESLPNEASTMDKISGVTPTNTYSNYEWSGLVANIKAKLALTDNAAEFLRYMHEGVFADSGSEDLQEIYVFKPLHYYHDNGNLSYEMQWYDTALPDLVSKRVMATCLADLQTLVNKDKALLPIMMYAGMKPSNAAERGWQNLEYRRDLTGKELIVKTADTNLYQALANADWAYCVHTSIDADTPAGFNEMKTQLGNAKDYSLLPTNYFYFGDHPDLKIGPDVYDIYPEETILDAGSVASAVKFRGPFRLGLMGSSYYSPPAGLWQWNPASPSGMGFYFDDQPLAIATNFLANAARSTGMRAIAKFQGMGRFRPSILNSYYGDFDYLGSGNNWRTNYVASFVDAGFELVRGFDLEPIIGYSYSHLIMNEGMLKDAVVRLTKLEALFGLNS
jgi:hypothetical protein